MVLACRFPHEAKVSRYELGSAPGERLRRQLVGCLFTMSEPDRGVGSSLSVQNYVVALRMFLRSLDCHVASTGLADLDGEVVDRFQDAMVARYGPGSRQPWVLVNQVNRDTFKLLLAFASKRTGRTPSRLELGGRCEIAPL
jgi:hypothetical protein